MRVETASPTGRGGGEAGAPADKAGTDTSIVNLVTGMPTEDLGSNDLPDGPEHEDYNLVLRRLLGSMMEGNPHALLNIAGQPGVHSVPP